jgi:hypothetical protein
MLSIRRVRNDGVPATVEREKIGKPWYDCDLYGSTAMLAVSCSGRASLSREQWEQSEIGHRRRDQATRKCHELETSERTGGDTIRLFGMNGLKEGAM